MRFRVVHQSHDSTAICAQAILIIISAWVAGCSQNPRNDLMSAVSPYAKGLDGRKFSAEISTMVNRRTAGRHDDAESDREALTALHETWQLHAHAFRSIPGYSARALASEAAELILEFGFLVADCEITLNKPFASTEDSVVKIPANYAIRELKAAHPVSQSSWVAEAAWESIPTAGSFLIDIPARRDSTDSWSFAEYPEPVPDRGGKGNAQNWIDAKAAFSNPQIKARAIDALATALTQGIALAIRDLLDSDGATRLAKRGAVYGTGPSPLEACAREDGIDMVRILNAALAVQDVNDLPPPLNNASDDSKNAAVSLASRIRGMMQPKDWWSTQRERLNARPLFISRSTTLLEVAKPTARRTVGKRLAAGARVPVTRNAFADKSEQLLGRLEETAEEFVSHLNAMVLESSKLDPEEVNKAWTTARSLAPPQPVPQE